MGQFGVNVDADFEPLYVVKDKKIVTQLKEALKGQTNWC